MFSQCHAGGNGFEEPEMFTPKGRHERVPAWFSEVMTDVHYLQQEELARLEKKIRDQGADVQQLVEAVGSLGAHMRETRTVEAGTPLRLAVPDASLTTLQAKLDKVCSKLDEQQDALGRISERLKEQESMVKPEKSQDKAENRTVDHITPKEQLTRPKLQRRGSKRDEVSAKDVTAKDLNHLRHDFEKELRELKERMDKDIEGLMDFIGECKGDRSQHFTADQCEILQTMHHLHGMSHALFALEAMQLSPEARERVKEVAERELSQPEAELRSTLLQPIKNPFLELMDEADYQSTNKQKFWARAFVSSSKPHTSTNSLKVFTSTNSQAS